MKRRRPVAIFVSRFPSSAEAILARELDALERLPAFPAQLGAAGWEKVRAELSLGGSAGQLIALFDRHSPESLA